MAIDTTLYNKRLFPHVDYTLDAYTLQPGGIICVTLFTYNEQAKTTVQEMMETALPLNDKLIHTALVQLITKKEQQLGTTGIEDIRKELREIDALPWRNFNDIEIIDPKTLTLRPGALYPFKNAREQATKKLHVSFLIKQEFIESHRELLPLFWHIAWLMSESIFVTLSSETGIYGDGVQRTYAARSTKLTHNFRLNANLPLTIDGAIATIRETLFTLYKSGALERLTEALHSGTLDDRPSTPTHNPAFLFQKGAVFIGPAGWRCIATNENCQLLFEHTKVAINFAGERDSGDLRQIFDL